jgi:hypothetical protein
MVCEVANKSFGKEEMFQTNQNYVHEEIKSRVNTRIAYAVEKFCFSFCCLKHRVKIHRTKSLPAVLFGCKT